MHIKVSFNDEFGEVVEDFATYGLNEADVVDLFCWAKHASGEMTDKASIVIQRFQQAAATAVKRMEGNDNAE